MGFDDLFSIDKETSAVDVLNSLLKKDSINFHTDLTIKQIRLLCKVKWNQISQANPTLSDWEVLAQVFDYYKELKSSYRRKRSGEIIKGLSELKDEFLTADLEKQKEKN